MRFSSETVDRPARHITSAGDASSLFTLSDQRLPERELGAGVRWLAAPVGGVPLGRLGMVYSGPLSRLGGLCLRLRGRGIKAKGRADGNQRVVLKVVVPKEPDTALTQCMEALRERRSEDPRASWRKGA